ncbi:hypothetical protein M430DRAFT_55038 [Amorphotheca resinae ATCC 22711]|uniref:Uncharacterized protein n=1 Tax=Amorphotheca resinae ATCC 22711 TaxID=857342 RepID=A0A2T3BDQ2_AMORE|nr:hypothetical protein M430DRAFT_55038 [Amorphotheca resinae ATCC 22711]PSS27531.1 hypothetical protein M430DRAFT_55038 [Amorphotheca resinae ATCC 22711]
MADGLNEQRAARVAELLSDFRVLQHYIAAAPVDPQDQDDYYAEGWVALRQCYTDGQHVLNSAAETRVPRARGGPEEQAKAELQQVLPDAYARRHEAQKIYLRQAAAQRWIDWRDQILQGQRPHAGHSEQLAACDAQLEAELAAITDDSVYADMRNSDYQMGRWTLEDPSLRQIQQWIRARR